MKRFDDLTEGERTRAVEWWTWAVARGWADGTYQYDADTEIQQRINTAREHGRAVQPYHRDNIIRAVLEADGAHITTMGLDRAQNAVYLEKGERYCRMSDLEADNA